MKSNQIFLTITLALFLFLFIPTLVQDGMFVDGVTYSTISKNLANGYGSFWDPHYTKILYPSFHEHPPLVFIIQSFFFELFGDAFYTERIYCLFITLLSGIGIVMCWRLLSDNTKTKTHYWIPLFFWLTIPIVSWSYKNNMLENTMTVFLIFSVYLILKSLKNNNILFLFLGNLLIVFAFLSKGVVGFFPIITPLIFGIVYHQYKKSILYFILSGLFLAFLIFLTIQVFPEISNNLSRYFDQQLMPALNNKREITTDNRFKIILDLTLELVVMLILVIYFLVQKARNKTKLKPEYIKKFMLFFLIALSASIPLIVTLKQRKFYLIPSIPFFALSLSFLLLQFLEELFDKIPLTFLKWSQRISITIIVCALFFSIWKFGDFSRDKEKLRDVYTISNRLPEGTIVSVPNELWSDWGLVAYFSRVEYISLDSEHEHEYFLIETKSETEVPNYYRPVPLKLEKYTLFRKI